MRTANMTSSTGVDARTVTFDNLDRPIKIVKAAPPPSFGMRRTEPNISKEPLPEQTPIRRQYTYVDKMYEKNSLNGATEEKTYIGPSTVVYRGTNRDVRYLHVDRLGSVEAVTTSTAASMFLTGTDSTPSASPGMRTSLPASGDYTRTTTT